MISFKSRIMTWVIIVTLMVSTSFSNPIAPVGAEETEPAFQNVSDEVGLDTPRDVAYYAENLGITGYLAGGQAWGDYNMDGFLDFYVTRHLGDNELYRGSASGTFEVETQYGDIGIGDIQSGGATFADYDNDGDQDLYVLNNGQNTLFRNDDTQFTNVTELAGVGDIGKGSSASWADYNQDGYLDLYVTNWLCDYCLLTGFDGNADKLYKNNGDGTFTDASDLLPFFATRGSGFMGSWLDYDNDGDLDLYVVNDKVANPIGNQMFRNDGPGCIEWCFDLVSHETGTDIKVFGMGLGIADIDHDFDLDMYFSNMGLHVMLLNDGTGNFKEETMSTGTVVDDVGWSTLFFDYDNNMYEDLFVAINDWEETDSELHRNTGLGFFDEANFLSEDLMAQGASYGDYNNDGWMDLLVGQLRGEYHLLENKGYERSYSANNWISFDLQGSGTVSQDAIGTRVYLKTSNELGHMKELVNGIGLGGGSQQILHFGLGGEDVELVTILWPDGTSQTIEGTQINMVNQIVYNPDGVLSHNDIIDSMTLEKYHNPMLDRADVIVLFVTSSVFALALIIITPVLTVRKVKKEIAS